MKTIGNVREYVQTIIPQVTRVSEVQVAVNAVIRKVNSAWSGKHVTDLAITRVMEDSEEALTFADANPDTIVGATDFAAAGAVAGDYAYVYDADNDANNGEFLIASVATVTLTLDAGEELTAEGPTTCTIAIFRHSTYYSFDNENHILTTPNYLKELFAVFLNKSTELKPRSIAEVQHSDNAAKEIFGNYSRSEIVWPSGIMDAADDELYLKIKRNFDEISTTAASATAIGMPTELDDVVMCGSLFFLLAQPKYRDDVLYKDYKEQFYGALGLADRVEVDREPSEHHDLEYKY